jgi:hypothetical protein
MKLINLIPLKEMGASVPKMYVKYRAVLKKIGELEVAQKALADKFFAEIDPKKKEKLMPLLRKGTDVLKSYRKNLADIEDKYMDSLDAPQDY